MSHHSPSAIVVEEPSSQQRWIVNAPVDLAIGCGGWTAPLLLAPVLLSGVPTPAWSVFFYGLALVANYPHYMATLYRACATADDRRTYRRVLVGATVALVLLGVVGHVWISTLPWIVTLYVLWSPWHYTGQNFGIAMIQFRRAGVELTSSERRRLWWAFTLSYALLLVSFNSGPQTDPLVLSLAFPSSLVMVTTWIGALVFGILGIGVFARLERRAGGRAVIASALVFLTQALWFTVPTLLTASIGAPAAPLRYSAGMLALMHSAQYLWITHYHARRDAEARGAREWRSSRYAAALVIGGIALFVPAPWLLSYVAHVDFSTSMLACAAVVNIHHFIVDGVVWKLRDARVASRLVGSTVPRGRAVTQAVAAVSAAGALARRRASRVAVATTLVCLAALDQVRYALALDRDSASSLEGAASLNPHDSAIHMRRAQQALGMGDTTRAVEAARRAVMLQPALYAARQQFAKILLDSKRDDEALAEFEAQLRQWPDRAEVLVNLGHLHRRRNQLDDAARVWIRALELDPGQTRVHLYVADMLHEGGRRELAVGGYEQYLHQMLERGDAFSPDEAEAGFVMIRAAELHGALGRPERAHALLELAERLAARLSREDLRARVDAARKSISQ